MTYKKRTILLIIISISCFLTIIPAILYSIGWRIDFTEIKIVRAGSFYFRIWPRNVEISLTPIYKDNPVQKEAITRRTLFSSIYIENILPKEYEIIIEKEGFYPWKKILKLHPGKITESKNITLVKKNPYFSLISENVDNFFVSSDENKLIFSKKNELYLFDLITNRHKILARTSYPIEDLLFSPTSEKILIKYNDKWHLLNLETLSLTPVFSTRSRQEEKTTTEEKKIIFSPFEKEVFYFLEDYSLYRKNLNKEEPELILENTLSVLILEKKMYNINKDGFLIKRKYENGSYLFPEKINEIPIEIKSKEYEIIIIGSVFYIREKNKLYKFNKEEKKFSFFTEEVEKIELSHNKEKVLLLGKNELRVLFLEKQYDQPERERGEILFLSRFSEKIESAFWWTNHYIIFTLPGEIKILEIDNRDNLNVFTLSQFEDPKTYWSRRNRKLILLSEKNLYISESLIF